MMVFPDLGNQREGISMYEDKTLVCKECGQEFVFTAGEQEFYAALGRLPSNRYIPLKRYSPMHLWHRNNTFRLG